MGMKVLKKKLTGKNLVNFLLKGVIFSFSTGEKLGGRDDT